MLNDIKHQISEEDFQKGLYVIQENERVLKASQALMENDLTVFGQLLFEAHKGAKNQFKISCDELDFLVDSAKGTDYILGARMMGGGFGGCTINLIHKDFISNFKDRVSAQYQGRFGKECTFIHVALSKGTHKVESNLHPII